MLEGNGFFRSSYRPVAVKQSSININGGSPDEEPGPAQFDRPGQESKLELFGFDSLVNILGLRRYVTSFNNSVHFIAYVLDGNHDQFLVTYSNFLLNALSCSDNTLPIMCYKNGYLIQKI